MSFCNRIDITVVSWHVLCVHSLFLQLSWQRGGAGIGHTKSQSSECHCWQQHSMYSHSQAKPCCGLPGILRTSRSWHRHGVVGIQPPFILQVEGGFWKVRFQYDHSVCFIPFAGLYQLPVGGPDIVDRDWPNTKCSHDELQCNSSARQTTCATIVAGGEESWLLCI